MRTRAWTYSQRKDEYYLDTKVGDPNVYTS